MKGTCIAFKNFSSLAMYWEEKKKNKITISENKDSGISKTHCKMNSENCIIISIYIYKCLHIKQLTACGQIQITMDCFYAFYTDISSSELF